MNKNLKKVISAVAALALSASSVAALAVDFPDVEETASYAQAVSELSALGVISGIEEGGDIVFKPDQLVTRAEITKMIVDARNEGTPAQASAGSSKFADVNNAGTDGHWARGYINQGVADGWISGYSDTEFGPDDNVTFVQAQKMLVAAAGYDGYAQQQGGWPSGYQTYAATLGIIDGVEGVTSTDQQLTRGQVAQMIDNAMDAPITIIQTYTFGYPVYEQLNKSNKNYQTMFTYYHKAYKVYGRVTGTSKTDGLDNDKVSFQVERADNFDDVTYKTSDDPRDPEDMYFGDTNAPDMLRTYAQALIQKNDDDEFTILSITAAAANKSVTVAAEDVDDTRSLSGISSGVIYFYPAGTTRNSQRYNIADDAEYYVNGVRMGLFDETALQDYIISNPTASVTLQKETASGSTSTGSNYNMILITTYETAVVEEVVEKSSYTAINFLAYTDVIGKTSLRVENDDDTITYSFKLDGEEIEPTDLQKNDVLSISFDRSAGFDKSTFYDVIVSRDTAEGKCTSANVSKGEYTIGDKEYKLADESDNPMIEAPETSVSYTVYLDHFGRIAYLDEDSAAKKLGILKQVYDKNNGETVAVVITKEGQEIDYNVDEKNAAAYKALAVEKYTDTVTKNENYPKQVIEYKVSTSSNKITIADSDVLDYTASKVDSNNKPEAAEYRANSGRIGSVKLSDASVIIDITDADDNEIRIVNKDSLVDGEEYTAYGYDKSKSDGTHRFVLIDGVGGVNSTTQLAIFNGTSVEEDGDEDRDAYHLVVDGEEKTVLLSDDVEVGNYAEGDVIVYATNAAGYITDVYNVFALDDGENVLNGTSYNSFKKTVLDELVANGDKNIVNKSLEKNLTDSFDDVTLVFGPVVDRNGSSIVISDKVTKSGDKYLANYIGAEYDISNAKIYTYDYGVNSSKASRVIADNGMLVTPSPKNARESDDTLLNLSNTEVNDSIVFALARVINDDEVQEIYLIVNEE